MQNVLKYGVVISMLFSAVTLSILVIKTFSFGRKKLYAESKGDVKKGIAYAFIKGMMPWEKESAGNHLPTYLCGILYHSGIFISLFYIITVLIPITLPDIVILIIQVLCLSALFSGLALLIKRILTPFMRELSCPDDVAANILVDIFLILAFLHTFSRGITPYFYLVAIIMFLYIPLGKIRHCFFFFYVRILYGIFYGRRGVFPSKSKIEET
jgi:hypothetical protein